MLYDGFDSGLFLENETILLSASNINSDNIPFYCWENASGDIVSRENVFSLNTSNENQTFTAIYKYVLDYTLNDDSTGYIVTGIGNELTQSNIEIPSFYKGLPVVSIGDYAFSNCNNVNSIVIPDSITTIGTSAFLNSENLETIDYNGTKNDWDKVIKEEGWDNQLNAQVMYTGSTKGLSFTLNDDGISYTLSGIGKSTDTDIVVPSTYENLPVTAIGKNAFSSSDILNSIVLPNSITHIGDFAFLLCFNLKSIIFQDGVDVIGNSAFLGCSSLTSIVLPNSVSYLGNDAFNRCSSLTNVVLSEALTSIESYTFYGCSSLTNIVIPDNVTSIKKRSFYNCSTLTNIVFPDGLSSIDNYSFFSCSSLSNVVIPLSLTSIGDYVFGDCSNVLDIYYGGTSSDWDLISKGKEWDYNVKVQLHYFDGTPEFLFEINDSRTSYFVKEYLLKTSDVATIPSKYNGLPVTSILDSAFSNCSLLNSIYIPECVTSIGDNAFYNCTGLTDIYFDGFLSKWESVSKGINWDYQMTAQVHYRTHSKGLSYSLSDDRQSYIVRGVGTSKDLDIVIPSMYNGLPVTEISRYAFQSTSIQSITLPSTITTIGENPFSYCSELSKVYINDLAAWCNIDFVVSSSNPLSRNVSLILNGEEVTTLIIPDGVHIIKPFAFC